MVALEWWSHGGVGHAKTFRIEHRIQVRRSDRDVVARVIRHAHTTASDVTHLQHAWRSLNLYPASILREEALGPAREHPTARCGDTVHKETDVCSYSAPPPPPTNTTPPTHPPKTRGAHTPAHEACCEHPGWAVLLHTASGFPIRTLAAFSTNETSERQRSWHAS